MTGLCPSSRGNARDLRKISPFGRNDIDAELGALAGGISESEMFPMSEYLRGPRKLSTIASLLFKKLCQKVIYLR